MKKFLLFLSAGIFASSGALAETGSVQTEVTVPSPSKIMGGVELRPSYTTRIAEFHGENYVQLGYQLNPTRQFYYRQEFWNNIADPSGKAPGLNLYAYDGSFRAKLANIWSAPESGLSLTYEGRAYLPTYSVRREAGMISALRQHVKLKKSFSPQFAVALEEIPIAHIYNQSGVIRKGVAEANPAFENRLYLSVEWTPSPKWKLVFPLILNNTRYRGFAKGAKNNDAWSHKVWINPELTYAVNSNFTVGVAYYSENLMTPTLGGFNIGSGLEKGVAQMILGATI